MKSPLSLPRLGFNSVCTKLLVENIYRSLRRSQVIECQVRRSCIEGSTKYVGWTDQGYCIQLPDGAEYVGHRVKVCLQDIRRSYAFAEVILPGPASLTHKPVKL